MSAAADIAAAGVMLDSPGVTVLDTREMPWTPYSDTISHMPYKNLAHDEEGDSIIRLMDIHPYDIGDRAKPAYHTAREQMFFLAGELTKWECDPLELTVCREGDWWDRLPGSVHIGGTPAAAVGATAILWMTAEEDPFVGVAESEGLIEKLAVEGARPVEVRSWPEPMAALTPASAYRVDRPLMKLIDTRALAWEPHPWLSGAQLKVLSRRGDGDPIVTMTWLPPGAYPATTLPVRMAAAYREFSYVLSGQLHAREYIGWPDAETPPAEVHLRAGCLLDRRAGAVHGFAAGEVSTGVTLLQWRLRQGSRMVKDLDKYRHTVVVNG